MEDHVPSYGATEKSISFSICSGIQNSKQKQLRCKKVAWPRKTTTKRDNNMRVWPRLTMHLRDKKVKPIRNSIHICVH